MTENSKNRISDEFLRLALVERIFAGRDECCTRKVLCGVGEMDDAALIEISNEECMVITSDFIRGSGFYLFALGYLNYFDVGYYLMTANVSDIAAMGARPCGALSVIRYADSVTDADFCQVMQGIREAADVYDVTVVGGDIGGHSSDVFAATVFGFMKTSQALHRKNAKVGDQVYVTGIVGKPITALLYFKSAKPAGLSLSPEEEGDLLGSWKRPCARIREGVLLSTCELATSCQDISDGLKATILQMSAASGKGFRIYEKNLPISESTKKLASFQGTTAAQIAMSASVDFQLLFTVPPSKAEECNERFAEGGLQCIHIGEVTDQKECVLVSADGRDHSLPGVTWKQQVGDAYLTSIIRGDRE